MGIMQLGEGEKEIFHEFGRKAGIAAVKVKWVRMGFLKTKVYFIF